MLNANLIFSMSKKEEQEQKAEEQIEQAEQVEQVEQAEQVEQTEESASEETVEPAAEPVEIDYKDKYLRLYAEFDNFRKRTAREKADLISSASSGVISQLLPLLDDFDRAAANATEDVEAMREGMSLIHAKLNASLSAKGLKVMEVKAGDDFDVDFHEAITNIPAPTPELSGKIVDVVEKGYLLGDKVIRYAKVVIGQ